MKVKTKPPKRPRGMSQSAALSYLLVPGVKAEPKRPKGAPKRPKKKPLY